MSLRGMGALLRYYFHVDPDALSDDEFVLRWKELQWVLRLTKPFQADSK